MAARQMSFVRPEITRASIRWFETAAYAVITVLILWWLAGAAVDAYWRGGLMLGAGFTGFWLTRAAYLSARGGLDAVLSEARRQTRYLAAFVRPTLAEASHHPDRLGIWVLLTLGLVGSWGLAVLTLAALRDRR